MLTTTQQTILKNAIAGITALASLPNNSDTAIDIAKYFNTPTASFIGWQSKMTPDITRSAITLAAMQLDNLTAGKRDALLYIVSGTLDARLSTIRQALDDLTGTQTTLKNSIIAAEKRILTEGEKLFSTGTGSDASPATTTFEGNLSYQDVEEARRS